jgi:hypothetical protein
VVEGSISPTPTLGSLVKKYKAELQEFRTNARYVDYCIKLNEESRQNPAVFRANRVRMLKARAPTVKSGGVSKAKGKRAKLEEGKEASSVKELLESMRSQLQVLSRAVDKLERLL